MGLLVYLVVVGTAGAILLALAVVVGKVFRKKGGLNV